MNIRYRNFVNCTIQSIIHSPEWTSYPYRMVMVLYQDIASSLPSAHIRLQIGPPSSLSIRTIRSVLPLSGFLLSANTTLAMVSGLRWNSKDRSSDANVMSRSPSWAKLIRPCAGPTSRWFPIWHRCQSPRCGMEGCSRAGRE